MPIITVEQFNERTFAVCFYVDHQWFTYTRYSDEQIAEANAEALARCSGGVFL